jgi:hypothetical protein
MTKMRDVFVIRESVDNPADFAAWLPMWQRLHPGEQLTPDVKKNLRAEYEKGMAPATAFGKSIEPGDEDDEGEDDIDFVKRKFPKVYQSWIDNVKSSTPWLHEDDFEWEVKNDSSGNPVVYVNFDHPSSEQRFADCPNNVDCEDPDWLPEHTDHTDVLGYIYGGYMDPDPGIDPDIDEDEAFDLVKAGKVKVDGTVCKDPFMIIDQDNVTVEIDK